ncbi:MAG: hypothetical protein HY015_05075 [Bacteroidetes bacterium]|nr:hypothetical protein [Bacteroidota bacterium]MBI3482333.1 hypothetical protein [Bacteroidota bacterium]
MNGLTYLFVVRSLIDKYRPTFDFNEIHKTIINASPETCYKAAMELDLSDSLIISVLFWLRGIPFKSTVFKRFVAGMKFTLLEESLWNEFVYGFQVKNEIEWIENKEEFCSDNTNHKLKAAWNLKFTKTNTGCEVSTETRVRCLKRKSKIIFSIYWFFIRPFSGLIRLEMLSLLRKKVS